MPVRSIRRKDNTVFQLQTYTTLKNSNFPVDQNNRQQDVLEAFNNSTEDYQQIMKKMMLDNIIIQWRNDILTSQPEDQEW
ncbi:hypothetical protein J2X14_002128 [Pantoea alhagi]|uniref:hypothetical protein n=1 Tax=Mixta sp. BE291 TaxID=3158787 RepID=UPI00285C132E|nr:hypothetical protein [Pantoea alhagi]